MGRKYPGEIAAGLAAFSHRDRGRIVKEASRMRAKAITELIRSAGRGISRGPRRCRVACPPWHHRVSPRGSAAACLGRAFGPGPFSAFGAPGLGPVAGHGRVGAALAYRDPPSGLRPKWAAVRSPRQTDARIA